MPKKYTSMWKNIFAEEPKSDKQYLDILKPYVSGDGNYIAASWEYFAYSSAGGGGNVVYNKFSSFGRQSCRTKVNVHKAKVLDLCFSPFNSQIVYTAGEDAKVGVTTLADYEAKEEQKAPVLMSGHTKKVTLISAHPTANGICATAAWDNCVKIWDAASSSCHLTVDNGKDNKKRLYSLSWNSIGSMIGYTDKDKCLTVLDPRQGLDNVAHALKNICGGSKASKVFFADNMQTVGYSCFNKQAKREVKLHDTRNMAKAYVDQVFDDQSSVLMPFYDEDMSQLFLYGKGDSSVSVNGLMWEKEECSFWHKSYSFATTTPQKGGCFVPRHAMQTDIFEQARFLKLTAKSIQPVSFCALRKVPGFDAELYPDCPMPLPSCTGEEYLKGGKLELVNGTMDPEKRTDIAVVEVEVKKTYAALEQENKDLKAKIAELEAKLAGE